MWWIVLLSSAGLICTGSWLLLREYLASKALPAAVPLDATMASRPVDTRPPPTTATTHSELPSGASIEPLRAPLLPSRLPAVETYWPRLTPEIEAAVGAVNASLASLAVTIAKPGEPTWSLHNRGFGDYRRVRVGGESIAWLRLELAADLTISAHLRTHEPRHEAMNRASTVDRPLTASRIAPAMAECLAALAAAAPQLMPVVVAPTPPPPPPPNRAPPMLPSAADQDRGAALRQWPHRPTAPTALQATPPQFAVTTGRTLTGWRRPRTVPAVSAATTLIDTAVSLVNSAFAEAGARLVPAGDTMYREPVGPHSRALSIDVAGLSVGLMLIEPVSNRIDIAVGVTDLANFDTARRRSHDLAGLTVHPLAETIATCAWPAIAAAKGGI